jgi:hypothetical protein
MNGLKQKTIATKKEANEFQKALDRKRRMHIICSRPKTQSTVKKVSDKKIANELQNWPDEILDKKTGLNIIGKPVSKNGLVNPDKSLKTQRAIQSETQANGFAV